MKKTIINTVKAMLFVFVCGLLFLVLPATNADAKMTNKKAWNILLDKIYNKYTRCGLIDLDNDGIVELISLEYSGEFVDGADSKKTLNVYKVKGEKAKKVFSYSIEGDYFRPTLDFRLFYNKNTYYMTVDYIHEGYGFTKTYKYTGKKFKLVSSVDMDLAEGENTYHIGKKAVSEKKYNKYMKDIFAAPVDLYLIVSDCVTQGTFYEYVEKQLMAEYEYRYENDLFEEQPTGTSYVDVDDDYCSELRVDTGKDSGYILYNYLGCEYYDQNNYYVGISHFTLDENGGYVFDELDEENYIYRRSFGDPYVGRYVNSENNQFYIDVVKKGDKYFFDVQYYPNAFELDEWTYETEMSGREGYEWLRYFDCESGGTYTKYSTDPETGKENMKIVYDDAYVLFILDGNSMEWHDSNEDIYEAYYYETFVKVEQ